MYRFLFLCGLISLLLTASIFALPPSKINYQGYLTDPGGDPVPDDSYSVTFTIYDAAVGGATLWTETETINTVGGFFSVILGSLTPITYSSFSSETRYLGVKVGSDPELSPRSILVSVPFAFRVGSIDGSLGGSLLSKLSIGPGHSNSGTQSFIAGESNQTSGDWSNIPGGQDNMTSADHSTIGGGFNNEISATGIASTIAGGSDSRITGQYSYIGSGRFIQSSGNYAVVAGGGGDLPSDSNAAQNDFCVVSGGTQNIASGISATIGGGKANKSSGENGTVSGGSNNNASNSNCTISGGVSNVATGVSSTVGGGTGNKSEGDATTVAGGYINRASGNKAVVGGGFNNEATGAFATTPGGAQNLASGYSSFAAGHKAHANHTGTFVWADSNFTSFSSTDINQFLIRAENGVGINTDSPSEALHVNGNICFTGTIGACSDIRFKTDVETITNPLEKILRMRGVTYRWKKDQFPNRAFDDKTQLGFIAQEIEKLYPEMVMTDNEGFKSVDYSRLTPVLVEAIKAQQQQINILEAKMAEIDELKKLVNQLVDSSSDHTKEKLALK